MGSPMIYGAADTCSRFSAQQQAVARIIRIPDKEAPPGLTSRGSARHPGSSDLPPASRIPLDGGLRPIGSFQGVVVMRVSNMIAFVGGAVIFSVVAAGGFSIADPDPNGCDL